MEGKNPSELILEAVRILIWPCMVAVGLVLYSDVFIDIIHNRKWKIGVVEVGDKVSSLEDAFQGQLQGQLDYLGRIRENKDNAVAVDKYVSLAMSSIESARAGVKNAVKTIQEELPQGNSAQNTGTSGSNIQGVELPPVGTNRYGQAKAWEALGFKYALEKDVDGAIKNFTLAEKVWPDYHNVAEIRKLLTNNKKDLEQVQSAKWNEIYKIILNQYSWGMPTDMLKAMQKTAG